MMGGRLEGWTGKWVLFAVSRVVSACAHLFGPGFFAANVALD